MNEDFIEPQPGEVFDLDRALSLAVCGYRVRATNMQPGAYVDYNFNGWRINFPGGSSSGWTPRDIDKAAEWVEVPIEAPKPAPALKGGWGSLKVRLTDPTPPTYVPPPIVKDVIEMPGTATREQAEKKARAAPASVGTEENA